MKVYGISKMLMDFKFYPLRSTVASSSPRQFHLLCQEYLFSAPFPLTSYFPQIFANAIHHPLQKSICGKKTGLPTEIKS